MKNKKIRLGIIAATAVVVIWLLLTLLSKTTGIGYGLYSRLHFFSKTGCSVTLTVDGEPCRLGKENVQGLMMKHTKENKVSFFRSRENGCRFRCRGGQYGGQPFQLSFQTSGMSETAVIPVRIVLSDSWKTADLKLNISADTSSGRYTYDITVREGKEEYSLCDEAELYSGEEIRISDI